MLKQKNNNNMINDQQRTKTEKKIFLQHMNILSKFLQMIFDLVPKRKEKNSNLWIKNNLDIEEYDNDNN